MIELLVYIFIMTAMLLMTSQFAVNIIRGQQRASNVQRLHQSVRQSVALLNYELRSAQSINTSTSVFGSEQGVLSFFNSSNVSTTYRLIDSILTRQEGLGLVEPVTPTAVRVESFYLTLAQYEPKNLSSLQFTLRLSTGVSTTQQFYRQSYMTSITLR